MLERNTLRCKEVTELATEYLEAALPAPRRAFVDEHVCCCSACQTYFNQMRQLIGTLGMLGEEAVADETRTNLLRVFREFHGLQEKPVEKRIALGIGDQQVQPGDHIAYFWESEQDFAAGVGFLEVGLRAGDCCFVFGHEEANQKVMSLLWDKGFEVLQLVREGRLNVLGGDRSAEAMLAAIGGAFNQALACGATLIRLLGNIGWGREGWPANDAILAFEAKVTEAARQFPCVVVCMYDVSALAGRIILKGGFETHPLTVRGRVVRENPYYVPVDRFLDLLGKETKPERIQ